ncbi:MATE family efflux transporter [Saccharicrinis sp. FJH62]|uniref:MATE family efflux transporter n=1 Tax=Saccharicrinis sp. FJH62 TaxID=3344657 RepID=UPI0035D456D3
MKQLDRRILKFAIPNIISNITVPLLGFVDMALMGHLNSPVYIGAISLGTVIFNFIYWSLGFLRMSTSGLTAQAYGRKDHEQAAKILSRALFIAIISGFFILLFRNGISHVGFNLLDGTDAVKKEAVIYFKIRVFAAPASIALFAFSGWFLGMHNARIPMIVSILINVFNILISVLFVVILDYKSDGVAIGTVCAQYIGLAMYIFYLFRIFPNLIKHISLRSIAPFNELKNFLSVSGDIFFRTLMVILVFTWFTSESAGQGNTILAVNSLFREFLMFFSFLMDGFAYSAEPIIGGEIGAGNRKDIRSIVRRIFKWGIGITVLTTLIYGGLGYQVMSLLTNQAIILETAKPYLFYIALIPLACFASFLWDGVYIGATASRQMLLSIMISTFAIFFPVWYIFKNSLGNHALWVAMLLFMFSRGIYLWTVSEKYIYKKQ